MIENKGKHVSKIADTTNYDQLYEFEPVHADWTGLRTQMVIGLLSIFLLCLINFIPLCQSNSNLFAISTVIDFTLYFASCSVIALITLEIGAAFGNRNGAACAMWAAIIFAISPWQSIICQPNFRISRLISFLVFMAIFAWARNKGKLDKFFAFISLGIALFCGLRFETNHITVLNPLKEILIAEYGFAILILFGRLVSGSINMRVAMAISLCAANAILSSELIVYPSLLIAMGALLAISLPFACLPTLGAAPIRVNQVYGSLGILALTLIAITYGLVFIGY